MEETIKYVSERFGIPEEDVISYHSGICYSRAFVRTQESAEKISRSVKGGTVNGGMLDGMPLGGISKYRRENGEMQYDVTC